MAGRSDTWHQVHRRTLLCVSKNEQLWFVGKQIVKPIIGFWLGQECTKVQRFSIIIDAQLALSILAHLTVKGLTSFKLVLKLSEHNFE